MTVVNVVVVVVGLVSKWVVKRSPLPSIKTRLRLYSIRKGSRLTTPWQLALLVLAAMADIVYD